MKKTSIVGERKETRDCFRMKLGDAKMTIQFDNSKQAVSFNASDVVLESSQDYLEAGFPICKCIPLGLPTGKLTFDIREVIFQENPPKKRKPKVSPKKKRTAAKTKRRKR
jgi:hypothetical protein